MNIDSEIQDRLARLRAIRTANQQGAQIASAIMGEVHEGAQRLEQMRREIDDMKQYANDNQHKKLILSIAAALGYTADDDAALQAINEFAATANDNGYTWQNGRFVSGDKALSNEQVKERVRKLRGEWVQINAAVTA